MTKLVLAVLIVALNSTTGFAGTLTIRDLKLNGNNQLEITLDGAPPKGTLEMDFVRDIVQFSIQNATIYPAKILHADKATQAFTKVFAYQYAPSLVRVRFSVDGKADQFQGKVKWEMKGKVLTVSFPSGALAKKEGSSDHEQSLLSKVLGRSEEVKVEKVEDQSVKSAKVEPTKAELKAEAKAEAQKEAAARIEVAEVKSDSKSEAKADSKDSKKDHRLTGNGSAKEAAALGGAKPGPSGLRAFLAMMLVVGGLGAILIYVKRKKSGSQAKKVGDSWISNLLSNGKKQKSLIEVVAVHALGPKQSITIVRIRGQQMVLGVTEGNVQLITQLDSDEEFDVLEDPRVADSIGKIFGAKPKVESIPQVNLAKAVAQQVRPAQTTSRAAPTPAREPDLGASFNAMLKSSSGAGAMVARNAYQSQGGTAPTPNKVAARSISAPVQNGLQSSVRDQIKQRLQGMRN